jgi:23S rRNA pseudouridine955/2504/2580 synthase/23S rRNA pseudouridine1911/1915/1917 synthase
VREDQKFVAKPPQSNGNLFVGNGMRFKVNKEAVGQTLLTFLRSHLKDGTSAKAMKRAIDTKGCRINGRIETFSTHPLKAGDEIEITLDLPQKKAVTPLYEDDDFIAVNKPAGITSESLQKRDVLIHRLDKETSGVILLAKNKKMLEAMIDLFSKHLVEKEYLALVHGDVKGKKGEIRSNLTRKHSFQGQTIYGSAPKGRLAITEWATLSHSPKASLLRLHPKTGRTHQIRVHMKEMGHSIVGDTLYGKNSSLSYKPRRHLLHAHKISFPHPITHKTIEIEAPLPDDFLEAMKELSLRED